MNNVVHNPWDIGCEQSLLGSALHDSQHLDELSITVEPFDFHDEYHQRIYARMLHLRGGSTVNIRTLSADLKSDPGWGETDGENYLDAMRLSRAVPAVIPDLIRILKDLAGRRLLVDVGKGLIEDAYQPPEDRPTQAISGEAMEALLSIGTDASKPAVKPHDVAGRVLDRARAHLRGEKPSSITTGFKKLDKAFGGGLQATDFMGVAARSGMGKSALLRSMGLSAARAGHPTLFFSTEMSDEQLTQGMLTDLDFSLKSKDEPVIQGWKFRAGCLSNYEIDRLDTAREVLDSLPFEICDDADLTMGAIRARARAFVSRHKGKLCLILTDFLQNIIDEQLSRNDTRENSITRLAYAHKRMAKSLNCAVGAAIQLKNKSDGKAPRDAIPTADDIRESGSIEMACDLLLAPHRQAFFHKMKEPTSPHDRQDWITWKEKLNEIENDLWFRGFKNRHGDPSALNLEMWCDLSCGAIRDSRPGAWKLSAPDHDEPLAF